MGKPLRALIVEDVEQDAELVVRELRRGGFDVAFERVDTAEAMSAALAKQSWDIVISDYSMPRFSAPLALGVVKERQLDLPFVVVSGTVSEELAVEAIRAGAHDFMAKGKLARLIPAVERELVTAEARREQKRTEAELQAEVAEHSRTEEALREREQRLSSIYDTVADVIFDLAVEGEGQYRFASVNQAFVSTTGVRADQVVGKRVDEVIPEPSLTMVLEKYRRAIRERKVVRWEETSEYPTGRLTGEVSVAPVFDDAGTCTHLVGAVHDITERKRGETALRKSESQYRNLVDEVNDGFFVTDARGVFTFANRALARILGVESPTQLVGRRFSELIPDSVKPELEEQFRTITATGLAPELIAMPVTRPDGKEAFVELKPVPIVESGTVVGTRGVVRDVTDRKRLEEQFRQAQKMESVGRLAGGVAHDFNNLLTVILGESEIAAESLSADHPVLPSLQEIRKAGERAAGLTRQLLMFSRQQVVEPTVLDVNVLVGELDKMLRRLIGEDIELMTRTTEGVRLVKVDRGQLEQVLVNLAVNARDAMPDGGKLTIETAEVELGDDYARANADVLPGEYVMLSVSDSGVGMSDVVKAHIFEPFFTTKPPGRGTGLGLATCYGIVKQAGGHIAAYSEPGVGTAMKVYLPIERAGAPARAVQTAEPPRGGHETILLVEDDPTVRQLAVRILKAKAYRVLQAESGEEALRMLEQQTEPVHLLFTDVVLKGMNGRALAERAKAMRPDLKVLYASGYTSDVALHLDLLEQSVKLVQKPYTNEFLGRKVREALDA